MTPDMKRLCDAVWSVEDTQTFREATGEQSSSDANSHERRRYEAIVRAVLMALREPSSEMLDEPYNTGWFNGDGTMDRKPLREEFAAMIDHVIGEPAKA